ncbi:MAG: single-stranded DNA-binding protein [Candidatus Liptonbacteria bacterium]|nr:single-stranded DNA-binding protein [Candidatus Liptonbacteria bacterium]
MNLNKAFLMGNVTADPQLRSTPSGQSVATFGLATNRFWTDKAGKRQQAAEFHNIVVWGRQAEIANQFLTKGSSVFIEGRIQTRTWQDKQGQQRRTTEIICERIQLGPRPAGASTSARPVDSTFTAQSGGAKETASGSAQPTKDLAPEEEIPVIDLDESEIKPEDLPF